MLFFCQPGKEKNNKTRQRTRYSQEYPDVLNVYGLFIFKGTLGGIGKYTIGPYMDGMEHVYIYIVFIRNLEPF